MWRNVYSPQPVLVGIVFFGSAFGWTTGNLSPALRSSLEEKLPDLLPRAGDIGAPDLVARLAQHVQIIGDVASPFCKVASRDEIS